ncbi:MAG: NCS2 family permease [Clostridia bacterium]|nr:NCS2 family permease [Clostridia bacterium]
MKGFAKLVGFDKKQTSVKTEIVSGVVTFLAMAYILTLNPLLMLNLFDPTSQYGYLYSSVFVATALGGFIGTLLMAIYAKLPLAQAPGLGLNSMVGGLLGGSLIGFSLSFGNAMLLVFASGVLFLLLSIFRIHGVSIREIIYKAIPESVRRAISVGIGLFIAIIGLANAGIVTAGDGTVIGMVKFSSWNMSVIGPALVCLVGFFVIAVLSHFNVKGAVIIGIIAATLFGMIPAVGVTKWSGESWKFWEHFQGFFSMDTKEGGTFLAVFTEGFKFEAGVPIMSLIMVVITFCMVDMFDTMGTCVGCCSAAGLMTEDGVPVRYNKIMVADSVATAVGSLLGTSTVTTFVESGAGISAGGKTGLTAFTTACLFLLSIFLLPLFASIPGAAAASALIWVGCLMLKGVKDVKVDSVKDFVPSFLTIAMMPFGYSITTGIGLGILSYVLIAICDYLVKLIQYAVSKKEDKVKPVWDLHVVLLVVAALFIVYFFVPVSF